MQKMVNGELIDLLPAEESAITDEREVHALEAEAEAITQARIKHKEILMRQKVESMLTPEFAQVDLAKTRQAIRAIRIK